MPMKKKSGVDGMKKEAITLEVKKEIIKKHEEGMRVIDLAKQYNKSTSTICTILKNKEKIKSIDAAKGLTVNASTKQRPRVMEEVEKLLLVWINEKRLAGDSISEGIICEKAKMLHASLLKDFPGSSSDSVEFKASRGWFEKFKRRTQIYSIFRHGEAASADIISAEEFISEFKTLIETEKYIPQQVFNCDETGLFWKEMPNRTFVTQGETMLPGHKPMKDRLTVLLCANASGDKKIKPLLVYSSENPRAFKRCKVQKNRLPVMWRSNRRALVDEVVFTEWINSAAGPEIRQYLLDNNLPLKAMLLMDNAPAHTKRIQDNIKEEFNFIKVTFLPPNTTSLLQPMDQQVINNFKKLYTKGLSKLCFDITKTAQLTLEEFWKYHFDIVACLKLIDEAWKGVTKRTLISAWRKLWPDMVQNHEMEPISNKTEPYEEIISLGRCFGLEVNESDINELIAKHNEELSIDELKDLHMQQYELEEVDEDKEVESEKKRLTLAEIKDHTSMWLKLKTFVEDHHPDKAAACRAIDLFDDVAMAPFNNVLRSRQKQTSINYFFKRKVEGNDSTLAKKVKKNEEKLIKESSE